MDECPDGPERKSGERDAPPPENELLPPNERELEECELDDRELEDRELEDRELEDRELEDLEPDERELDEREPELCPLGGMAASSFPYISAMRGLLPVLTILYMGRSVKEI